MEVSSVGINYKSVVERAEVWRVFSSSFSHLSLLHLAMNVNSLLGSSYLEVLLGSVNYFS